VSKLSVKNKDEQSGQGRNFGKKGGGKRSLKKRKLNDRYQRHLKKRRRVRRCAEQKKSKKKGTENAIEGSRRKGELAAQQRRESET